jgi:hydrogenase maturation protein HypF
MAVREPRRVALALLHELFGTAAFAMDDLEPVSSFTGKERRVLATALAHGLNAPLTSSAGRLFDGIAAITGVRQKVSYEGQAACELEAAIPLEVEAPARLFEVALTTDDDGETIVVDWTPVLEGVLRLVRAHVNLGSIAAPFHEAMAEAAAAVARRVGERKVVLTGGCFQNARLTAWTVAKLRKAGFQPYWHGRVPPNDGGIALGQAAWAARTLNGS